MPEGPALDRHWAGWRSDYLMGAVAGAGGSSGEHGSLFEQILCSGEPDDVTYVLWRGEHTFAILNAYPYNCGHLMVLPKRAVADLEDLTADESAELWAAVTAGVRAVKAAYQPQGVNVGLNLGHAAGAGVPDHLHVHCLPRWFGDTNFVTTIAEARVLPEALSVTWQRLRAAWPT